MSDLLTVTGLTREFRSADAVVTAVDDVSFSLGAGVFCAVVGTSGSGKSTLLSLLGTLDKPTAGSVTVGDVDIATMSDAELTAYRREEIGFVFQSYNLIPNLTAVQNVMLPMEFAGLGRAARQERATHLLDQVGLTGVKQRRKPGRLSGGEQQRVAIARALANRPSLILADEPTGNLDSETGALIVELLRDLARTENVTVVAVTHDASIAALADRTFRLKDGLLAEGSLPVSEASFPKAIQAANEAYEAWLLYRDDLHLGEFTSAISELIECAPDDRRLSSAKIRRRYAEAAGTDAFEALMEELDDAR